jgi:predicted PurR-regulated permease PerM
MVLFLITAYCHYYLIICLRIFICLLCSHFIFWCSFDDRRIGSQFQASVPPLLVNYLFFFFFFCFFFFFFPSIAENFRYLLKTQTTSKLSASKSEVSHALSHPIYSPPAAINQRFENFSKKLFEDEADISLSASLEFLQKMGQDISSAQTLLRPWQPPQEELGYLI